MRLREEEHPQALVFRLQGDLIERDIPTLRSAVENRLAEAPVNLILDLSQLEYADSQGLETLLWIQDHLASLQRRLHVVTPSANLLKILQVTRLLDSFVIFPDVDSALANLRASP